MRKNNTIFDFVGQIFIIFGFTVICLNIFCLLCGEDAKEFSTIFELGRKGISSATLFQFLLEAVFIVILREIFFTDKWIKKASIGVRTVGMFSSVIITIILLVCLFGWFPIDMWQPWVCFILSFATCAGVSTIVSVLKEKSENKKMEEALQRLKEGMNE